MPIEFVGGKTASVSNSQNSWSTSLTDLTGGIASAPAEGDLVVVVAGDAINNTWDITSGYTDIGVGGDDNGTFAARLRAKYKRMTSTPDTSVSIGGTGLSTVAMAAGVMVFRGVNAASPIDVVQGPVSVTNSVLANPPSITPAVGGAWIVAAGIGAHNRGNHTFSSSGLTGFISRAGNASGPDCTVGIGYNVWTGGPFDPTAFTFSAADLADFISLGVTFSLRPERSPRSQAIIIH